MASPDDIDPALLRLLSDLSTGKRRYYNFSYDELRRLDPGMEMPPEYTERILADEANAKPRIDDRRTNQPGTGSSILPAGFRYMPQGWQEHGAIYDPSRGVVYVSDY